MSRPFIIITAVLAAAVLSLAFTACGPKAEQGCILNDDSKVKCYELGHPNLEGKNVFPNATIFTVVKMVDFSYKTIVNQSSRRGPSRAAAPTVQSSSARESHPGTPIWSPFRPHRETIPVVQPQPDWVYVSASPAGVALQAPVSAAPRPHPSTSRRASLASSRVR